MKPCLLIYTTSGEACIFKEVAPCLWKTGYPRPGTPTLLSSLGLSCQACWLLSGPLALSSSFGLLGGELQREAQGPLKRFRGQRLIPSGSGQMWVRVRSAACASRCPLLDKGWRRNLHALPPSIFCANLVYWLLLFMTAGHALGCAVSAAAALVMNYTLMWQWMSEWTKHSLMTKLTPSHL